MKSQLLVLRGCSAKLVETIDASGPILCDSATPPIYLARSPKFVAETGRVPLPPESIREIDRTLALRCDYDTRVPGGEDVRHRLDIVAIALQLVKPTYPFLELWLQLDEQGLPELVSTPVRQLGFLIDRGMYLAYQQHNVIEEADVKRALSLIPRLASAMDSQHGSWDHPFLSIHRALIFFCQGYSIRPTDSRQFLWAAGLDCLCASKLDPKKRGSPEITRRLEKLLGAMLKPYDTVSIPSHQMPRNHLTLKDVGKHIFKMRNAFAHGLTIPDPSWLTSPGQPEESGYAYQLLEQTEIVLRLSLTKVLEDQALFDTFSDPNKLDAYFQ
jgi:hypothetical protein